MSFTGVASMPTNNSNLIERIARNSHKLSQPVDGSVHHIRTAGIIYTQRIQEDKCLVEYEDQMLGEGSVIKIRRKTFRVDDCMLERVYHACGPNLILMLSVVCRVVEKHKDTNLVMNFKRDQPLDYFDDLSDRRKRVITESCCENFCNISELTRYCHE